MLEKLMKTNLLKYFAGRAIFCPICDQVADYRHWVVVEKGDQFIGACCSSCFDSRTTPDATYTITRLDKPKRSKPSNVVPAKPGKALNNWLRKAIFAGHKDSRAKQDRLFPAGYGSGIELRETVLDDGTVSYWYSDNAEYSSYQISEYVRKYCELNHLKAA